MRRQLPPWAMGLALAPLGFYFGFISTALPILLAAHHVSVEDISRVSAIGFSPSFWAFLLCPILDVGLTKRTYAFIFAAIAAVCLTVSTLVTFNLPLLTVVVTTGCAAAVIFGNALGGWLPDIIEDHHYDQVGGTSNIANLGAAGVFGTLTIWLMRTLHPSLAAGLLGLTVFAPTVLLLYFPLPRRATRTAAETFRSFFRDLYRVCKRRNCLLGLLCFLSPTACFALTNLFSSLGEDFHTSEWWVTALNGTAVAVVCSLGCLAGIPLCRGFKRRTVYVMAGFGGAAFALALIWMPHTLVYYAIGVLGYNFFQGINYTAFSAFEFEIVGPGNPLAATQISLLTAAANLPISYMTAVDGHFHTTHGLAGMFGIDAVSSIGVGVVLLLVFRRIAPQRAAEGVAVLQAGA